MAAISCPQCKRILNLPDDREIETVSCPMCKHAFAPPATPKIVPSSIAVTREIVRPHFDPIPVPLPSRPPPAIEDDEDRPAYPDKDDDQRALESAAGLLKTMAFLGLVHTMPCCGCIALALYDRDGGAILNGMEEFVAFLCLSMAAYTFILIGARALRLQSSYAWAVTGIALALLSTAALILINVPVVLSFVGVWTGSVPVMGQPCCGGLLIVPSLLVIVFGAIGSIKGMLVLMKPDIRELYFSGGVRSFRPKG